MMDDGFTEDMADILSLSSAVTLVREIRYMQDDILTYLRDGRAPGSTFEALDKAVQILSGVEVGVMAEVRKRAAQIVPQEGSEDAPGTTED